MLAMQRAVEGLKFKPETRASGRKSLPNLTYSSHAVVKVMPYLHKFRALLFMPKSQGTAEKLMLP